MAYSTIREGTTPIYLQANQFISIQAASTAVGTIAIPAKNVLQAVNGAATFIYGGYGVGVEVVLNITAGRLTVLVQDADPTGSTSGAPFSLTMLSGVNAVGDGPVRTYPGGSCTFTIAGTFNDTVATLQYDAGLGYLPVDGASFSAPGNCFIQGIPTSANVKVVVAFVNGGSVVPSGLNATLAR
jgi:hypothetical protein